MQNPIYKPRGRAREYSPLALNIYRGCGHGCEYCYVNAIPGLRGINMSDRAEPREGLVLAIGKQLEKEQITDQVLLCFTGDPYCPAEMDFGITREVLTLFDHHNVATAILTKGGRRVLRDIDILKRMSAVKVGATLTFTPDKTSNSLEWEKNGATPSDRLSALKELHENNIQTWVSLEPVLDPTEALKLIDLTHEYVDGYKVGTINHHSLSESIDWNAFGLEAVNRLRKYGKRFYVKHDLAKHIPKGYLRPEETDMNRMNLTSQKLSLFSI